MAQMFPLQASNRCRTAAQACRPVQRLRDKMTCTQNMMHACTDANLGARPFANQQALSGSVGSKRHPAAVSAVLHEHGLLCGAAPRDSALSRPRVCLPSGAAAHLLLPPMTPDKCHRLQGEKRAGRQMCHRAWRWHDIAHSFSMQTAKHSTIVRVRLDDSAVKQEAPSAPYRATRMATAYPVVKLAARSAHVCSSNMSNRMPFSTTLACDMCKARTYSGLHHMTPQMCQQHVSAHPHLCVRLFLTRSEHAGGRLPWHPHVQQPMLHQV